MAEGIPRSLGAHKEHSVQTSQGVPSNVRNRPKTATFDRVAPRRILARRVQIRLSAALLPDVARRLETALRARGSGARRAGGRGGGAATSRTVHDRAAAWFPPVGATPDRSPDR